MAGPAAPGSARAPSPPCRWARQRRCAGWAGVGPVPHTLWARRPCGGRGAPTASPQDGTHSAAWQSLQGPGSGWYVKPAPLTAKTGPRPGTGGGRAAHCSQHAQPRARDRGAPALHGGGAGGSPQVPSTGGFGNPGLISKPTGSFFPEPLSPRGPAWREGHAGGAVTFGCWPAAGSRCRRGTSSSSAHSV